MGDEIEAVTETAKAVQEVAKTTGKVVDATQAAGAYLARMLGTAPEDVVGLLGGNYLRDLRISIWSKIGQRTFEKLDERHIEKPRPLNAKLIEPLLDAASAESDETLQEMWADLLANAMDPNKDTSLRLVFIETLKSFEPLDALLFQRVGKTLLEENGIAKGTIFNFESLGQYFDLRATQVELSSRHLHKLGCIRAAGRMAAQM